MDKESKLHKNFNQHRTSFKNFHHHDKQHDETSYNHSSHNRMNNFSHTNSGNDQYSRKRRLSHNREHDDDILKLDPLDSCSTYSSPPFNNWYNKRQKFNNGNNSGNGNNNYYKNNRNYVNSLQQKITELEDQLLKDDIACREAELAVMKKDKEITDLKVKHEKELLEMEKRFNKKLKELQQKEFEIIHENKKQTIKTKLVLLNKKEIISKLRKDLEEAQNDLKVTRAILDCVNTRNMELNCKLSELVDEKRRNKSNKKIQTWQELASKEAQVDANSLAIISQMENPLQFNRNDNLSLMGSCTRCESEDSHESRKEDLNELVMHPILMHQQIIPNNTNDLFKVIYQNSPQNLIKNQQSLSINVDGTKSDDYMVVDCIDSPDDVSEKEIKPEQICMTSEIPVLDRELTIKSEDYAKIQDLSKLNGNDKKRADDDENIEEIHSLKNYEEKDEENGSNDSEDFLNGGNSLENIQESLLDTQHQENSIESSLDDLERKRSKKENVRRLLHIPIKPCYINKLSNFKDNTDELIENNVTNLYVNSEYMEEDSDEKITHDLFSRNSKLDLIYNFNSEKQNSVVGNESGNRLNTEIYDKHLQELEETIKILEGDEKNQPVCQFESSINCSDDQSSVMLNKTIESINETKDDQIIKKLKLEEQNLVNNGKKDLIEKISNNINSPDIEYQAVSKFSHKLVQNQTDEKFTILSENSMLASADMIGKMNNFPNLAPKLMNNLGYSKNTVLKISQNLIENPICSRIFSQNLTNTSIVLSYPIRSLVTSLSDSFEYLKNSYILNERMRIVVTTNEDSSNIISNMLTVTEKSSSEIKPCTKLIETNTSSIISNCALSSTGNCSKRMAVASNKADVTNSDKATVFIFENVKIDKKQIAIFNRLTTNMIQSSQILYPSPLNFLQNQSKLQKIATSFEKILKDDRKFQKMDKNPQLSAVELPQDSVKNIFHSFNIDTLFSIGTNQQYQNKFKLSITQNRKIKSSLSVSNLQSKINVNFFENDYKFLSSYNEFFTFMKSRKTKAQTSRNKYSQTLHPFLSGDNFSNAPSSNEILVLQSQRDQKSIPKLPKIMKRRESILKFAKNVHQKRQVSSINIKPNILSSINANKKNNVRESSLNVVGNVPLNKQEDLIANNNTLKLEQNQADLEIVSIKNNENTSNYDEVKKIPYSENKDQTTFENILNNEIMKNSDTIFKKYHERSKLSFQNLPEFDHKLKKIKKFRRSHKVVKTRQKFDSRDQNHSFRITRAQRMQFPQNMEYNRERIQNELEMGVVSRIVQSSLQARERSRSSEERSITSIKGNISRAKSPTRRNSVNFGAFDDKGKNIEQATSSSISQYNCMSLSSSQSIPFMENDEITQKRQKVKNDISQIVISELTVFYELNKFGSDNPKELFKNMARAITYYFFEKNSDFAPSKSIIKNYIMEVFYNFGTIQSEKDFLLSDDYDGF